MGVMWLLKNLVEKNMLKIDGIGYGPRDLEYPMNGNFRARRESGEWVVLPTRKVIIDVLGEYSLSDEEALNHPEVREAMGKMGGVICY